METRYELPCELLSVSADKRQLVIQHDHGVLVTEIAQHLAKMFDVEATDAPFEDADLFAHLTLEMRLGNEQQFRLIDPFATVETSALAPGCTIRVTTEAQSRGTRDVAVAAWVDVLNTRQKGSVFSLVHGENVIGRSTRNRVALMHESISRTHASVVIDEHIVLSDAGSSNGVWAHGQKCDHTRITRQTQVRLGDVKLRITPTGSPRVTFAKQQHNQPLKHQPPELIEFEPSSVQLPSPPTRAEGAKLPTIALVSPVIFGGVMFALTHSPFGLVMIALTPLMMLTSWLDGHVSSRKKLKRSTRVFHQNIERIREELEQRHSQELRAMRSQTPNFDQLRESVNHDGSFLLSRNRASSLFCEIVLGEGSVPSRTRIELPYSVDTDEQFWPHIEHLKTQFHHLAAAPITLQLIASPAIGVTSSTADGLNVAFGYVLQLAAMHGPDQLMMYAIVGEGQRRTAWNWLAWLPHSRLWHESSNDLMLANSSTDARKVLRTLERIIEERCALRQLGEPHTEPAVCLVIIDDDGLDEGVRDRVVRLLESASDLRVHALWVSQHITSLQKICDWHIHVDADQITAQLINTREGTSNRLERVRIVTFAEAESFAKQLSTMHIVRPLASSHAALPDRVRLSQHSFLDAETGPQAIRDNWVAGGSVMRVHNEDAVNRPLKLSACVGQTAEGDAIIDLREHGPHALVGGTTGSGKSEFLQTFIMSMALNVSPDSVNFLLIDYKGGSAFAQCANIPHCVGLITDLQPHLTRRILTSLRAEIKRREALFAKHEVKDIIAMESLSHPETPPSLVIVIDEFAALLSDVPEFIDGMIDVAQRGRSLGLHLMLATQRPGGVVTQNLRANTNLRIALRMADAVDSYDVIGAQDAAKFESSAPGRAAMVSGSSRLTIFQAAFLGGSENTVDVAPRIRVDALPLYEQKQDVFGFAAVTSDEPSRSFDGKTDIERLAENINVASIIAGLTPPRRPWHPELPDSIAVSKLTSSMPQKAIVLGLEDAPEKQMQYTSVVEHSSAAHWLFVGAAGSGKTTALLTLSVQLSQRSATRECELYVIDASAGAMRELAQMPGVADVADFSAPEHTTRMLEKLTKEIRQRKKQSMHHKHLDAQSQQPSEIVLFIDAMHTIIQDAQRSFTSTNIDLISEILRTGKSVGVHVIATCDRPGSCGSTLSALFDETICLRLANVHDYASVNLPLNTLSNAAGGRAIKLSTLNELQIAHIGNDPDITAQLATVREILKENSGKAMRFHKSDESDVATDVSQAAERLSARGRSKRQFLEPGVTAAQHPQS